MKLKLALVLLFAMSAGNAFADDKADADMAARLAAAQAKLNAKAVATTNPALSDDPKVLRSIIAEQNQKIADLQAQLSKLTGQTATDPGKIETPANGPDRFAEQRKAREVAIPKLIADERKAKAGEKDIHSSFGGNRDAAIKSLQDELNLIHQHPLEWIPPIRAIVGSSGRLASRIQIAQIIDGQNMLAHLIYDGGDGNSNVAKTSIWISGVDTSKFADGKALTLPGVFTVTGNKTYDSTDGGTSTVLVYQLDAKEH